MNNLEIENERLKLTIKQLECKIDLLRTQNDNEIDKYNEIIRLKDNYIKLIESLSNTHYYELAKRIDNLVFFFGNKEGIDNNDKWNNKSL